MKVAIMQPTYLPWMGYFALMDSVDTFVYLDDVQLSVQSWQQRNRIKTSNRAHWLTVPIERNYGQKICDVSVNYQTDWRANHWKTIQQYYSKAPHFKVYEPYVEALYQTKWYLLSDFCQYIITILSRLLNIKIPVIYNSSSLYCDGVKTDRVISILKNLNATEYISGPAAKDYIEPEKFEGAGIELKWFEYNHPIYPQIRGDFISHLSAIDLLFNTGEDAINYIRKGYEQTT